MLGEAVPEPGCGVSHSQQGTRESGESAPDREKTMPGSQEEKMSGTFEEVKGGASGLRE